MDVDATKVAIAESGLPVDGTVNSTHWQIRHTDKDPAVRAKALESLQSALRATHAVGGHTTCSSLATGMTVLKKKSGNAPSKTSRWRSRWRPNWGSRLRSKTSGTNSCTTTPGIRLRQPTSFVKYVDELNSPWVGMQFDIGNHWKYGSMGDWIRQLGKRVIKLDVKGYSRASDKFTRIAEGDIDYLDVRKALTEINYYGWVAAEVSGGDAAELKKIAQEMDQVFRPGLKRSE